MMRQLSDADWEVFQRLYAIALERFCEGALAEAHGIALDTRKSAQKRLKETYKLIRRMYRDCSNIFDDVRRSTAFAQLLAIDVAGVLTPGELAEFSPELQERLSKLRVGWGAQHLPPPGPPTNTKLDL